MVGIVIGWFVERIIYYKNASVILKSVRPWISRILWYGFVIFIFALFMQDVKNQLIQSEVNLFFIKCIAYFGLAGLLSLVVQLPFQRWEQIKFFGFEYKRKLDEVESMANEELKILSDVSGTYLEAIGYLSSQPTYTYLASRIGSDNKIKVLEMAEDIITILKIF